MKRIILIPLLLIICISHLNIIDALVPYSARYTTEENAKKDFSVDEETEKGKQEKEKAEEQEKYYSGNHYKLSKQFQLPAKGNFICFSITLNTHPYRDDDIQPPQAV